MQRRFTRLTHLGAYGILTNGNPATGVVKTVVLVKITPGERELFARIN